MTAMERARVWAREKVFDARTRAAARAMMADEAALEAAFGQELSFGTGGLRGVLGVGTGRMNEYTVARATQGLADYLRRADGAQGRPVVIGYDSRHGSRTFAGVAACVLAQNGLPAFLFDRLLPTPVLSFAVRQLRCAAGIMITASHNPAQYNGYKVYGPDGCQLTDRAAGAVTRAIERACYAELTWGAEEQARAQGLLRDVPRAVYDGFIAATLALRGPADQDPAPIKLVYTPLHGTGLEPVRDVLARMPGVTVVPVRRQCAPDGDFPTCPKPNPELPAALALALAEARTCAADLVLATDPDCDRVGVAARQGGALVMLTGNEVGLLLMRYLLERSTGRADAPLIIKTIVTSDLAFGIAAAHGAEVREVLTGFKYIGEMIAMMEARGEAGRFLFGFEESCGYLYGTHVRDKDGVMACLLVTGMAQFYAQRGMTLHDALGALYETYGYMDNALVAFDIPGARAMDEMRGKMQALRADPPSTLAGAAVTERRDYLAGLDGLPPSDVMSFLAGADLKAIVRPSGTEPKIKVYLSARAVSMDAARAATARMAAEFKARFG